MSTAPLTKNIVDAICVKNMPKVETCVPLSGEYTSPIVAPRWLSMKLPTFSAIQKGTAAKNPIRKPMNVSFKATSENIQRFGSPGGMVSCMTGITRNENASTAARRAMPGIMESASAGHTAKAPPMRAMAMTAASIQRWNST